jgi:hypothetical protein
VELDAVETASVSELGRMEEEETPLNGGLLVAGALVVAVGWLVIP